MKQIYQNSGYKVFRTRILGYPCDIHQTEHSGCLVNVPMGKNDEERAMFDNLVYFHKGSYWGKTIKEARKRVFDFIKSYQSIKYGKMANGS